MNTRVFENEISSGLDITSHGIPSVDDLDTTPPECILPGLTSTIISSKKRKSCDDFSTSIKYDMDGKTKSLANPSIVRDKFFVFKMMISEELECLSTRQQIYTKKLM